ncbi:MAG: TetR family transcriptional regulator [Verrucomicrobiota bacterium]
MRDFNFPFSRPKRNLLEAAEELFATKGFDLVSVRDITKAAKANVAAVNYHFGGREELISLVVMRYVIPVNDERLARLDALEKKHAGKVVPLELLLDAFTRPLVEAVRKSELSERLFCRLMGRILSMPNESIPAPVLEQLRTLSERFQKAFSRVLPEVTTEELLWRIHFVVGSLIHMLSHQEVLAKITGNASGTPAGETIVARFIRFAAAGLRQETDDGAETPKGPQELFNF